MRPPSRSRSSALVRSLKGIRAVFSMNAGPEASERAQVRDRNEPETDMSDPDPIKRMKVPDVISAIGRGFSPERAVQLLEDDFFLRLYDIREWVGRQPNQTRRMRSRLIGTNGRIRTLIEEHTGCEISIYGSTVAVIGDDESLALAAPAIEGILGGSEHGTVLFGLEQDRKRQRLRSKNLDTFSDKSRGPPESFESLVPGFSEARKRMAGDEPLELEEGESVSFGEE